MSGSIPVKSYLLIPGEDRKEMRRFVIEPDVVGDFTYLKEKARSIYPQLLLRDFELSYVGE